MGKGEGGMIQVGFDLLPPSSPGFLGAEGRQDQGIDIDTFLFSRIFSKNITKLCWRVIAESRRMMMH